MLVRSKHHVARKADGQNQRDTVRQCVRPLFFQLDWRVFQRRGGLLFHFSTQCDRQRLRSNRQINSVQPSWWRSLPIQNTRFGVRSTSPLTARLEYCCVSELRSNIVNSWQWRSGFSNGLVSAATALFNRSWPGLHSAKHLRLGLKWPKAVDGRSWQSRSKDRSAKTICDDRTIDPITV